MIKALIFDLDGTTLDTVTDLMNSINLTLKDYGFNSISYEETKQKTGSGFRVLIKRALPENVSDELIDEATLKFSNYYATNYAKTTKPYKNIPELISYLNDNNYLIGVNSNKKQEYTKKLVELNFPSIKQKYVFGKRDNLPIKPDPINNNEILALMKLNNDEVLYVGDSDIDYLTAKNSHLKFIAVTWGFRDKELLKNLNPDYLVDDPLEIIDILNGLNKKEDMANV